MRLMKFWILSLLVLTPFVSYSQDDIKIRQNGKLVDIQVYKSDPIRIFVIGKNKRKLDMNDVSLVVKNKTTKVPKTMKLDRETNHFIIDEEVDLRNPLNLEITTKMDNRSETLDLKVQ